MLDKDEALKIAGLAIPPTMSILSSVLMLKYDKPVNNKEIVHRIFAAAMSTFIIGIAAMIYISNHTSWLDESVAMTERLYNMPKLGEYMLTASVFSFSGLFGWGFFSGVTKWMRKNGDTVIERALNKATKNEEKSN